MNRRRIEYDPEQDPTATVALAEQLRGLLAAQQTAGPLTLVMLAAATEVAARAVTDAALVAADEHHSRREIATAYGASHDAVNRRLRRIRGTDGAPDGDAFLINPSTPGAD